MVQYILERLLEFWDEHICIQIWMMTEHDQTRCRRIFIFKLLNIRTRLQKAELRSHFRRLDDQVIYLLRTEIIIVWMYDIIELEFNKWKTLRSRDKLSLLTIDNHWLIRVKNQLTSTLINGHQFSSTVINSHQCSSTFIKAHQHSLRLINIH